MITVLIVDDIETTQANLQKLLSFEDDVEVCGIASNGQQAIDEAKRLTPNIILMDVNMPVMDGIQATEILAQEVPQSPVIIMSVQGERDYLRRAMQAGAREFLIKPFSSDELVSAIRRVYQLEQKKGTFQLAAAAAAPAAGPVTAPRTTLGEVILLFSGKGGVGKSVMGINLSIALGTETGGRVALVDLDLQFGDISLMLNLNNARTITELVEHPEGITAETLDEVMPVGPGDIRVLASPLSPELADLLTPEQVRLCVEELRKTYDFVVVDTAAHLDEFNLQVMELATSIILISSLTIPSAKSALVMLKVFDSLSIDPESIILVANRVDSASEISRDSLEAQLRTKIAVVIPHEAQVVAESIAKAQPFVLNAKESKVSQSMRELVGKIVPLSEAPQGEVVRKRGRLFGR